MYKISTIILAVLKIAAKRNVIISAIQVTRLVYLTYRFFSLAREQQLFKGKPKTWNKKKIFTEVWNIMKPFGNPMIKTSVTRSYGVSREDLNFIEFIFEKHIIKKPQLNENTTLIEDYPKERP